MSSARATSSVRPGAPTRWTADAAGDPAGDLEDAAGALAEAIEATSPGRIDHVSTQLADALVLVRDAARACLSAFPRESGGGEGEGDAGRTQAKGMVQEVFVNAERMAAGSQADVLWLGEARDRFPARLHVAPLQVWGPMRDKLLTDKTVVFTSATLMLGGDFGAVATSLGLKPTEREGSIVAPADDDTVLPWKGLDVGSPFDYGQQAILYVARHLPQPGRDGLGQAQLDEICDLVDTLDGRTLGLFSSRRAAETAAEAVRAKLPHLTTLAQGDAQLPELAKQFVEDPHTCLFGTLSLWQGLDVPGETCQLVIIDRIPFPRPDDPLMSARAKAADAAGGNGFMEVSATHAALLLAQGAGRLIRTMTDRGVVAVLDPRLETARYGRVPQGVAAADVVDDRPGARPPGAEPARSGVDGVRHDGEHDDERQDSEDARRGRPHLGDGVRPRAARGLVRRRGGRRGGGRSRRCRATRSPIELRGGLVEPGVDLAHVVALGQPHRVEPQAADVRRRHRRRPVGERDEDAVDRVVDVRDAVALAELGGAEAWSFERHQSSWWRWSGASGE